MPSAQDIWYKFQLAPAHGQVHHSHDSGEASPRPASAPWPERAGLCLGGNDLCSCKLKQGTEMPRARRGVFPGHSRAVCGDSALLSSPLRAVGLSA